MNEKSGYDYLRVWTSGYGSGVAGQALVRFPPGPVEAPGGRLPGLAMAMGSLIAVALCGLPLALGCRRIWRFGYRRGAWLAGIALGAVTVARLLGPAAIAVYAVVLRLPIWAAWWWLVHRA